MFHLMIIIKSCSGWVESRPTMESITHRLMMTIIVLADFSLRTTEAQNAGKFV